MLPSKEEVLDFLGVSLEEHYPATWPDDQEFQGLAPPPSAQISNHRASPFLFGSACDQMQ